MVGKNKNTKRFDWRALGQAYLAPAGLGVIFGAVSTAAVTIPKLFDKTQEIHRQGTELARIEADYSAYAKVMKRFNSVLSRDELKQFFDAEHATELLALDESEGTDDWYSVQLMRSPEKAMFLWVRGGMNSVTSGAQFGVWLTRKDAIRWARKYRPYDEVLTVFSNDELQSVDGSTDIEKDGGGQDLIPAEDK